MEQQLRKFVDNRLQGLRTDRYSWWVHWRELADYILPRRYKWLITANQASRGSVINQHIIDSTGTTAARVCASGMMTGITSPTRPWFKLKLEGFTPSDSSNPVSLWLAECEKRMMRVYSESNFYNAMAVSFLDLVVFGTAPIIIYEDYDDVIRCVNPCAGEYFIANSSRMMVDTLYREFVMTIAQVVREFGEDKVTDSVRTAYKSGQGAMLAREVIVCHAVEPNTPALGVPPMFEYRETYWEKGSPEGNCLRYRGFHELPFICPRWDLVSNDAYGRSPGMDALGDIKQLQQEQKRKAQAIDKMVNPPLVADVQLKNQPASLLPGGITYVAGMNNIGIKPIFHVNPPVQELMEDIKEVQERVRTVFFNDLFMMISQLQTVRTATEIDARREEKLIQLGPVLERFENEALDPIINRTFAIMHRAGLLPPAPPEIQGSEVQIQYVSMLAEAQKAVSTSGIERLLATFGNLAAVRPDVLDNLDFDAMVDEYATLLGVSPTVIRSKEQVAAIRQQQQQAVEQEKAQQQVGGMVEGAKVLSETDVGGGQNALQSMMGLGGPMQ